MKYGKRGMNLNKAVMHIVLIGMIFAVFLVAMDVKVSSRGVKQQVLEKELALLIDAADEGFSFEVRRNNPSGIVDDIEFRDGRIFVSVDGLRSADGYSCFSRFDVKVEKDETKFIVRVG